MEQLLSKRSHLQSLNGLCTNNRLRLTTGTDDVKRQNKRISVIITTRHLLSKESVSLANDFREGLLQTADRDLMPVL